MVRGYSSKNLLALICSLVILEWCSPRNRFVWTKMVTKYVMFSVKCTGMYCTRLHFTWIMRPKVTGIYLLSIGLKLFCLIA